MKYLMINADDFGYCPKRNQAILDLWINQSITSTSLLVNGNYAFQACLAASSSQLPMGIHLNLTEGRPITKDHDEIRTLIDSNGFFHGKFGLRNEFNQGNIQLEHVEYEIRAQINEYFKLTNNSRLRHLDGHQHIHIHPSIVDLISQICREYDIEYIRTPIECLIIETNSFHKEIIEQAKQAKTIFAQYHLKSSDYFFGLTTMGENMTFENIEKCLKTISTNENQDISIEFMCHPGYPSDRWIGGCGTGETDEFSQSNQRQIEFDILRNDQLKSLFDKYEICIKKYNKDINTK